MPLDAVCLTGVVRELQEAAAGLRIEKIQQPARDLVVLTLRGSRRLLLCAGASQARIHLTDRQRENPAAPPMFCMLLRKHLSGGYLTAVRQPELERVVILDISVMDEMGVSGQRQLVLECMGRSANLILLDGDGRIVDCLRRVDLEKSPQRQVLPGLFYRLPAAVEKISPLDISRDTLREKLLALGEGTPLDKGLLDLFTGLSPLVCRELVFRAFGDTDVPLAGGAQIEPLLDTFQRWQDTVRGNRFTPYLVTREGRSADFSYLPIGQYGAAAAGEVFPTFSALLDAFYESRERQDRLHQRGQDLLRAATTARDRVARKLGLQRQELAETESRERLRIQGELITANLYRMEKGARLLRAENYYEAGCPAVEIPLDPLLTPQQNAARYFKRYQKAKTAQIYLTEQIEKGEAELQYLNSILDELSWAELEQDFADIRGELLAGGYLKGRRESRREPRRGPSRPRIFHSTAGLTILVGRSNLQNDKLTREADRRDIWLHTQKIHGSHVILRTGGLPPDDQSLTEAAMLAAWFSQGRDSSLVAVDYTQAKNVRKPAGAAPGMVVYTPYQTAYVKPDPGLADRLTGGEKG